VKHGGPALMQTSHRLLDRILTTFEQSRQVCAYVTHTEPLVNILL